MKHRIIRVRRSKGLTIIELEDRTLRTRSLNRHRYNDLRKMKRISTAELLRFIGPRRA